MKNLRQKSPRRLHNEAALLLGLALLIGVVLFVLAGAAFH